MTVVKLKQPSDEIMHIDDRDDVEQVLRQMWPEGRIPVDEFHAMLQRPDISMLKCKVGCNRTFYGIGEIADLIWSCSNYERSIDE